MDKNALIIVGIVFALIVFFDLRKSSRESKSKDKYEGKTTKEIDDLLWVRWKHDQPNKKEQLKQLAKKPHINIDEDSNEWWNLHMDRLKEFGKSKYLGQMYYMGKKGGIYTVSANGTRNYKY